MNENQNAEQSQDAQAAGSELKGSVRPRLRVHFVDVGREKKSWTSEVDESAFTHRWMFREIKAHAALMSATIDAIFDGNEGRIYAGIRSVGTIRYEAI